MAAFGVTAYLRVCDGPERDHIHAKSRYWAVIILAIIFVPFCTYISLNFCFDLIGKDQMGLVSGRYEIQTNRGNVKGFWIFQNVKVVGMDPNKAGML